MTTDTALKLLKGFSIASAIINPIAIPVLILNYKNTKEEWELDEWQGRYQLAYMQNLKDQSELLKKISQ